MNKLDIDSLTVELSKSLFNNDDLNKAMPPMVYRKLRQILQRMKPHQSKQGRQKQMRHVTKSITEILENKLIGKELKKNNVMASVYDNGDVRLDFGSEVPESIKKAALAWAKRQGFTPVEATLNKSLNASNYVIYHKTDNRSNENTQCLQRVKWTL